MRRPKRHLLLASAALLSGFVVPAVATASLPRIVVAHVSPTLGTPAAPLARNSSFDVVLQPQQAALNSYLAELTDPASPNYRHFLTTAQFAKRFGPSVEAIRTVRNYLVQNGLKVTHVNAAGTIIRASGSTSAIAHAFSTSLLTYRYNSVRNLALTSNASLPHDVGQYVKTLVGLSGITSLRSKIARTKVSSHYSSPTGCTVLMIPNNSQSSVNLSDGTSNTPLTDNRISPPIPIGYDLKQQGRLYGLTSQWAAGNYGAGEKIAMYELANFNSSDVSTYKSCYGLTNSVQTINVDGGPQSADNANNASEEANLDIEEAAGLAPGATILVYQSTQNISTAALDTYAQIADDNQAQIVSTSWGACEFDTSSQPMAEQLVFQQMAVQGQTVFSAAGDYGSSDCAGDPNISVPGNPQFPGATLAVDDPSSQPYVTAVGGLTVSNLTTMPTVWDVQCNENADPYSCNTASGQSAGGGGGGMSSVWSLPSWQDSAAANLSPSPTMRMLPDLSVMADPQTGFIVQDSGGWSPVGGTSIGSPLMSGLLAVAANACGVTNFGFINPTLYSMPSNSFVDVGSTNPNSNAVAYGTNSYMSGVGYDMASGLGAPSATSSFINNLCPSGPQANHSLSSATSTSLLANGSGTTVTVTARDRQDAVVSGASIGLTFSTTAATPVIVNGVSDPAQPLVVTADGSGVATFTINSATAGTVTITPLIGSQTIGQPIVITFTSNIVRHPPTVPTIIKLTALVKGIGVTLRAPSSNGGSSITHYQYSLNGKSWVSVGIATAFNITKLSQRAKYSVRVRAQNAVGFSPASAAKVITTR
jgi:subtilase family serine protease